MTSKTIYLFYGEDTWSLAQKARRWQEEFVKKYGDLNLQLLDGESSRASDLLEAANAASFFGGKKLVIVQAFLEKSGEEEQKKLADKLEEMSEESIILFLEYAHPDARTTLFKRIKKIGQIEEFQPITDLKLVQWIEKAVQQKGGNISSKETKLLAETVGSNLWQMQQEIEKLLLYAEGKPITSLMIEDLVSPNLSASVFKLTDYLGQKQIKASLKTFHDLIASGEDTMKIFFMLVRQFRLLIQVRDALDHQLSAKEIMGKMKDHPYVISTTINQSKNFTEQQLQKIYRVLLELDSRVKNGKIKISTNDHTELRLALEKFMVELCR